MYFSGSDFSMLLERWKEEALASLGSNMKKGAELVVYKAVGERKVWSSWNNDDADYDNDYEDDDDNKDDHCLYHHRCHHNHVP